MAWTAPMTAVANAAFTAAQFNTHVRDNLLETAPAKATAAGRFIVTTGVNSVAERETAFDSVVTSQTTSSTSYVDLSTVGPSVTVTTGTKALVFWRCQMSNSAANTSSRASVDVSGATSIDPDDNNDLVTDGLAAGNFISMGTFRYYDTLTAGSNTFKVQYKVGGGTGTYADRMIAVIPL